MSSIDPELLVQLGRHRWTVALIAILAETTQPSTAPRRLKAAAKNGLSL
jgi:hypothetical protein